ncbi:MAG: DUF3566 domain-containing protein [Nocardioidaceae bacterium]|nr:MAG: DUF3566 domain-containing protein [Nocardioidaceae bacterium]
MSERSKPDTDPLVPRRTLAGSTAPDKATGVAARQPLSERVAAAIGVQPQTASPSATQPSTAPAAPSAPVKPAKQPRKRKPAKESKPAEQPAALTAPIAPAVAAPLAATGVAGTTQQPPAPQTQKQAQRKPAGRTRKARLRLVHVDPMSVAKTAFLLSVAIGIVTVVAVSIVWLVLNTAGVWDSINSMVADVVGNDSGSKFDIEDYLGTTRVLGFTMLVAVVDVVLITAIATLAAFLYNLAAALLGGVEVTLAEDER